jgi:hypothetical protein
MSTNTNNTKAALNSVLEFIKIEPSFASVASSYGVDLSSTMSSSQETYADATALGADLSSLFTKWDELVPSLTDAQADIVIKMMLVEIDNSEEELVKLKASSTLLSEYVNSSIPALQTVSNNIHAQIITEQEEMVTLRANMNSTVSQINQINKELSGSSGFLEGFLTGITAGIYSGLRDKLNKAKSLRSSYAREYVKLQQTSNQKQNDQRVIPQIDSALRSVQSLYTSIVSLENTMEALSTLAKSTEHDGTLIVGTENGKVAAFYRNRFNKDMTALLEWKNVFPV